MKQTVTTEQRHNNNWSKSGHKGAHQNNLIYKAFEKLREKSQIPAPFSKKKLMVWI